MNVQLLHIKGLSEAENRAVESRMMRILTSWHGTPHMDGQQCKGRGVDCVRFVAGVLDELAGTKTALARLPYDASFHNKDLCFRAFRQFRRQFKGRQISETTPLEPGDVIITGPASGGPGHAIILGPDLKLWQALSKVGGYSLDILNTGLYKYKATIRAEDRTIWRQHG